MTINFFFTNININYDMPYTFSTVEIELIDNFTIYVPRKWEKWCGMYCQYIYILAFLLCRHFHFLFLLRTHFKTTKFKRVSFNSLKPHASTLENDFIYIMFLFLEIMLVSGIKKKNSSKS